MKKIYSLFLISLLVFSCENEKEIISIELTNDIVPIPKEINFNDKNKGLAFSKSISVFYKNSEISPLIQLFKKEIQKITSLDINFYTNDESSSDFIFKIDDKLNKEEYQIDINEKISITSGSYNGLVMAKNTLLQLMSKRKQSIVFPLIKIKDY